MSFRITGLAPDAFAPLFDLDDAELAARGIERRVVNAYPGYPDRIGLDDAPLGETVLLLNHAHHDADTPFRATHAIYVRRDAPRCDVIDEVPPALRRRVLSLRGFDARGYLVDADLASGEGIEAKIEALLANPRIDHLDAHYAKPGCFAARVERA